MGPTAAAPSSLGNEESCEIPPDFHQFLLPQHEVMNQTTISRLQNPTPPPSQTPLLVLSLSQVSGAENLQDE